MFLRKQVQQTRHCQCWGRSFATSILGQPRHTPHTHTRTCTRTSTRTQTHTNAHTCMHARTRTHTRIHDASGQLSGSDKRDYYMGEEAMSKRGVLAISYPGWAMADFDIRQCDAQRSASRGLSFLERKYREYRAPIGFIGILASLGIQLQGILRPY